MTGRAPRLPPLDLKRLKRQMLVDNIADVQRAAHDHLERGTPLPVYLADKIRERVGILNGFADTGTQPTSFTEVVARLADDDPVENAFRWDWAKNPSRQGADETATVAHLDRHLAGSPDLAFTDLPATGKRAWTLADDGHGKVCVRRRSPGERRRSGDSKSIDAYLEVHREGLHVGVFLSLKHTEQDGGAQDNQAEDVAAFLKRGAQVRVGPRPLLAGELAVDGPAHLPAFFIALVDGAYYHRPRGGGDRKVDELRRIAGANSRVGGVQDLPALIAELTGCVPRLPALTAPPTGQPAAYRR